MAAQLKYSYNIPKGAPGEKFDISFDEVVTRMNQETDDGVLKFGVAAQTGDAPGVGIKIPVTGAAAKDIEGIVVRSANTERDMQGHVVVRSGASVGVMRRGKIWGRIASDAVPVFGATAYVVLDGDEAGYFTGASAAASVYIKCSNFAEVKIKHKEVETCCKTGILGEKRNDWRRKETGDYSAA